MTDFFTSIVSAVRLTESEFLFFSRGEELPHSSFIEYLSDQANMHQTTQDMIYGETWLVDKDSGDLRWGRNYTETEMRFEKDYVCSHLPFVVRKAAFLKAIQDAQATCRSMEDVASMLFDVCSRKRVFRPASLRISRIRSRGVPESEILLMRLKREFACGALLFRFLDRPILKHAVLGMFDWYLSSPTWVRSYVRRIAKPFWIRRSQKLV